MYNRLNLDFLFKIQYYLVSKEKKLNLDYNAEIKKKKK